MGVNDTSRPDLLFLSRVMSPGLIDAPCTGPYIPDLFLKVPPGGLIKQNKAVRGKYMVANGN